MLTQEQISGEEILYDADFSHKIMPRTQGDALTHHYSSVRFKDVGTYILKIFVGITDTVAEWQRRNQSFLSYPFISAMAAKTFQHQDVLCIL